MAERVMGEYERKFRRRAKRVCTQTAPKDPEVAKMLEVKWGNYAADDYYIIETVGYLPNTAFQRLLGRLHACTEARLWVGSKSMAEAWATSRRADWMYWLLNVLYYEELLPKRVSQRYVERVSQRYVELPECPSVRALRAEFPKLSLRRGAAR
jgi:hypothetical protein